MAIDRKKMSQAITNGLRRPATNPYGDGSWVKCKDDGALPFDVEKAKALIKDYGKPVEFKMMVTATPRGRTIGQVLQQFWKQVGANMEIEQVDQATFPPRAFMRQFQLIAVAHRRSRRSRSADVCKFPHRQPGGAGQLLRSGARSVCSITPASRPIPTSVSRIYCAISRLINKEAIWFWTFQNTYYAISTAKLKGLPKIYNGVIDVSDAWLE